LTESPGYYWTDSPASDFPKFFSNGATIQKPIADRRAGGFLALLDGNRAVLEPLMSETASKVCPIHQPEPLELPFTEFGVCRARKDGKNLYCKGCIRKKVYANRRMLKEYRASRRQHSQLRLTLTPVEGCAPLVRTLSPTERVREAIRRGARTQSEIRQDTGLTKDEIGDAIANLLLWSREIKTQIVADERLYFINESPDLPIRAEALAVQRQGDVRVGISRQGQTADGRKRQAG
jgi:hypothetical protein